MAAAGWIGRRVFQAVYIWVCLRGYSHNLQGCYINNRLVYKYHWDANDVT